MAFDPVLMIMQPRRIPEAINSLNENVDISKVWFRAYTEPQVLAQMNKFIKETNYSHYIVMGDDGVVSKKAANTILKYGEMKEYDVFTGWMNMHLEKDGSYSRESTVNVNQLKYWTQTEGPEREDYPPWVPVEEVQNHTGIIQISMANFAMTIAERDIFLKFPLQTHINGRASDHHWSYRLQQAGVTVHTHTDAFIKHLRRGWTPWKYNWLVGNVNPEIIYETKWRKRETYV